MASGRLATPSRRLALGGAEVDGIGSGGSEEEEGSNGEASEEEGTGSGGSEGEEG